nr:MAG TPA: hypothetical protein [Caudoviricetes sp.]
MRPRRTIQNSTFLIQNSKSCSLSSRTANSLKKYFDYDYKIPPKGSNLRKGLAGRGMGMLVSEIVALAVLLLGVA